MSDFEIIARDTATRARSGRLTLGHGAVDTPAFMPVGTNATVKAVALPDLAASGVRLILSNAYHLYLRPGLEVIERAGGLHRFMAWDHNLLTDSGGFQVFSLAPFRKLADDGVVFRSHIDGSRHSLTPADIIRIQTVLGSDIMMPLDVCSAFGASRREAEAAMQRTTLWAHAIREAWDREGRRNKLFGIVQGNFFPDLRAESAADLAALDLPGYAIGGLSVGENPELFLDTLKATAPLLPERKPRYVMGIGTPWHLIQAVGEGIDLFDCVFPTRTARNAQVFTGAGPINLRNERFKLDMSPLDPDCACPVCGAHTRAYLRHLFKCGEILAAMLATRHNLFFLESLMKKLRAAIAAGRFAAVAAAFLETYQPRSPL
jgi:queuine tRNA-ribosyltransferase